MKREASGCGGEAGWPGGWHDLPCTDCNNSTIATAREAGCDDADNKVIIKLE